jgi:hypothetical protein
MTSGEEADMDSTLDQHDTAFVDLYWLPLGAGEANRCVRLNGRIYEGIVARHDHRAACDLYHTALQLRLGPDRFVVEMAPVWLTRQPDRGVVSEGPVGLPWLGRSRLFRYEVRRWRNGVIPDITAAVASPQRLSTDADQARLVLDLVPAFPTATWGLDELRTGDMWNSNSLTAWLLARTGHHVDTIAPPPHGRAPGWTAGLIAAARAGRCDQPNAGARQAPPGSCRGTGVVPVAMTR